MIILSIFKAGKELRERVDSVFKSLNELKSESLAHEDLEQKNIKVANYS